VVLSVTDTGAGIPGASNAKIFDPFFATEGNYGMGLSIAHGIITGHGGNIDVESSIG
jgi:signal transduction histidine kinase